MKQLIILIFLLSLAFSELTLAQTTLTKKVFETGSKTHFDNFKKCDFYFECDCCSGKLLFPSSSDFLFVNYCMSDFVVTKGTYMISNGEVTLNFDGKRIDVKYNWELEMNPNAEPTYFVNDSTITKYQLNYKIEKCEKTMLVNEQENETFIAIETDLLILGELEELKKYKLEGLLNLK
jgi:hypothetical protein